MENKNFKFENLKGMEIEIMTIDEPYGLVYVISAIGIDENEDYNYLHSPCEDFFCFEDAYAQCLKIIAQNKEN